MLAELQTPTGWPEMVQTIGIPGAFALGLLLLIWRAGKALGPHVIEGLKEHNMLVTTLSKRNTSEEVLGNQIRLELSELGSDIESVRRAGLCACDFLHELASRIEIDTDSVQKIRQSLEHRKSQSTK